MTIYNLTHRERSNLIMEIAKRDKVEALSEERSARVQEEIVGRLLVVLFILSLIVFSYFSFV